MIPARGVLVAAAVLLATSGCGALTGRSVETWAQDRGVTAHVKTRLAAMDAGTVTRIHVDTYESIVYLTGGVTSTEMKRRAESIAREVPGVEQVVNNLHLAGEGKLASASSPVPGGAGSPAPSSSAGGSGSPVVSDSAGAASPAKGGPKHPAGTHPILRRFPRLARADLETGTPSWTRYAVFDAGGRHVATMYSVAAGELARNGAAGDLTAEAVIDHVSIYRQGTTGSVMYDLVLWHVNRDEVARLE